MNVFHVTTPKKLARYRATGAILPPVRFWPDETTARRWMRRTGRSVLLTFERPATAYPLPDHRPALWTPDLIHTFELVPEEGA
ncbi:MAG: hypothetical protein WC565_03140 [Parcubacteria group bacterium]